ncbi:MAG: response regulator [candidate division WOR-3 bacterium]|nr:response regulator [candidate division WOR-3 bacterium]
MDRETKYNIILVEDNKDHQRLIQVYLENTDVNLTIANNEQELMEKIKQPLKYDLMLLDIQLPKTDGYAIAQKIKAIKKDLKIIGLSAFAMRGDKEKAIAKGMIDYLTKPIDKKSFLKTIYKHLKSKK